jgi:hypothetical protein
MKFKQKLESIYKPIFVCLVLLRATFFWICWPLVRSGMPWSVALMYRERGDDTEYLPPMAGIAHNGFLDAFDVQAKGTGVTPSLVASMALHAGFFRVLGVLGFIIADCSVAVLVYFLFSKLLQKMKVTSYWSDICSLVLVVGGFHKFFGISKILSIHLGSAFIYIQIFFCAALIMATILFCKRLANKKLNHSKLLFYIFIICVVAFSLLVMYPDWWYWGWRFPRPFVSEIFFLGFMVTLLELVKYDKVKLWLLLGVFSALIIQSDIFRAAFCLIFFAICWSYLFVKQSARRFSLLKGAGYFALSCGLFCVPFFIQRKFENPDMARRFGAFSVDRLHPFVNHFERGDFYFLTLIISLFCVITLMSKNKSQETKREVKFLSTFYLVSWFTLPLFIFVTGKVIHMGYFYAYLFHCISTFVLILCMTHFIQATEQNKFIKVNRAYVLLAIIFFALFSIARDTQTTFELTAHTRSDFIDYKNLPNYQKNLSDLVRELDKPEYKKIWALGTFDPAVQEWWCGFKNGLVFNPDPFFSTRSDAVLEARLVRLGSIIGMSAEDFITFLSRPAIDYFFLGSVKYQLFKGFKYSSLNDYESKEIEHYYTTDIYSIFNLVIPISEKKRLYQKFENEKNQDSLSPDLIILTSSPGISDKNPNSKMYRPTFSNEVFRVWVKQLSNN